MPTYMRHLENPANQVNYAQQLGKDDTMTIVSKNQGWITVQRDQNRKKPIEKFGVAGDATKTSYLTPQWMQLGYPKNKTDTMI